jgi:pyoverdine/dityrosine biosynthesis protein Dit1
MSKAVNGVLNILMNYSRLPRDVVTDDDKRTLTARIDRWLATAHELTMVLPAFPHKSPNCHDKVLGVLPDGAEEHALITLDGLCRELTNHLNRACHVTICSDGFAFSDILGVSPENVTTYQEEMKRLIRVNACDNTIKWYEWLPSVDNNTRRNRLIVYYGTDLDTVKNEITTHPLLTNKYAALKKFISHDMAAVDGESSRHYMRRCGDIALRIFQRSAAHGKLIKELHPDAFRLSIHPHVSGLAEKFPVKLIRGASESWATPWHNVLVDFAEHGAVLMKRRDAEDRGYKPIMRYGRFWHYI